MNEIYHSTLRQLYDGCDVVMMSLIASSGSTPRSAGAKMALFSNGDTAGTVGGGAVEYNCISEASLMHLKKSSFCKSYVLRHDEKCDIGMVCGGDVNIYFQYFSAQDKGNVELFSYICYLIENNIRSWLVTRIVDSKNEVGTFDEKNGLRFIDIEEDISPLLKSKAELSSDEKLYVEPIVLPGTVYVFGGGHVSQALVPMLCATDFSVVVYEDNEKFADKSLFSGAKKTVFASFLEIDKFVTINEEDYVIILTRGHSFDKEVLRQVLSKHPSYLGVIGSSKKVESMREYLRECGFDEESIMAIHSPIGIDINAQTPAEIGISITAQLINHRALNS